MDDVPVVELLVGLVLSSILGPYFYIPSLITIVRWRFMLESVCGQVALTAGVRVFICEIGLIHLVHGW